MSQTITAGERGGVVTVRTTLIVEECGSCGAVFAFAQALRDKCLEGHGRRFYCPNGHAIHYVGQAEAERFKRERDWARSDRDRVTQERDHAEASRRGQKAANTRLKRRVANGVCPCCKRSFKDLGRHMAGQHPDFGKASEDG